ncbi:desulfoferrodoxin [Candidatus Woesearchaeota archaeon]|jgi:superoxide reductase|nr:desulfoferrodoxin [Candidatus Woesearchaeota archaeon]MBT5271741.1 desulfoferrodoxin [Candidatus Woesearchaeota archaeon]MBT6041580.1 desulfoferrodoxin [Candidatus Woesearchaeota archaeon]MBT6337395.1 desulfoferrodoxin [Candidatus Woesearchaeota archaeon]MBT7927275.1 desulfoferrodoxin [Candidatus Woesearchaeota archaeon]
MTKQNEVYKCEICGNIVEVIHQGVGELVCCGQAMKLMQENTEDASQEKHVPIVERDGNNVKVKVGSVAHPMETEHYIEWIEIKMVDAGRIAKRYLKPGDNPEVEFHTREGAIEIRAYCNLHGLWKAKI